MRRRLLVLTVTTTAAVLVLLTVPLLAAYAEQRAVDLHQQRLAAATRFAALADSLPATVDTATLGSDLERYDEVTRTTTSWLVDTDGSVLAPADQPLPDDVPGLDAAIAQALNGTPTTAPGGLWPWSEDRMVVATPIGRDAQVLGAVVMVDDTAGPRADVGTWMAVAAVAGTLFVALLAWLVGVPLVRWVVRPVEELEERVQDLGQGRAAASGRVEGPPELRRLVASFNEMASNVEHSRQQQRDLIADVSHQLANPLTALRLRLEHLARDDESVLPVLAETDRMARSLEDVIEISRAGGLDRAAVDVDVAAQVRERVELWQPLFGDLLTLHAPDGSLPALLEDDLVPTIVDVALDNAAKYAPGAAVEIGLELDPRAGLARLRVLDHGPGVTGAEADEIGGRFHRLPRHADVDGTGLGLSILQLRVRDADGTVTIRPGTPGLEIVVTLPVRPAPGSTAARPGGAGSAG
ncbi:HAMP domain-containing sensor histidine kinase [Aeromicrobium alkaliterrae]|uniref:histidine kinase n=1 Tax=Aeromicrobium alkaliterrae TaxID=302168 RepID=A0ABN2JS19_9ACTN